MIHWRRTGGEAESDLVSLLCGLVLYWLQTISSLISRMRACACVCVMGGRERRGGDSVRGTVFPLISNSMYVRVCYNLNFCYIY